jgi:hypothetical protein
MSVVVASSTSTTAASKQNILRNSRRHLRRRRAHRRVNLTKTRAVRGDDDDDSDEVDAVAMSNRTASGKNEEEEEEEDSYEYGIFGKSIASYASNETSYSDSVYDKFAIALFNAKLAGKIMESTDGVLSSEAKKFSIFSYERLVYLANEVGVVFKGTDAQRAVVTATLLELIPEVIRILFKKLIKPSNWVDEMNSFITVQFFGWLVGPSERVPRESDGVLAAVKLKKCRYLEQSGCVGSCTNFCKVPTENFFKEAFGVDAHLHPNHTDGSCVLTFGEKLSDEEIFSTPCHLTCKSRKGAGRDATSERDDGSLQQTKCWKLP